MKATIQKTCYVHSRVWWLLALSVLGTWLISRHVSNRGPARCGTPISLQLHNEDHLLLSEVGQNHTDAEEAWSSPVVEQLDDGGGKTVEAEHELAAQSTRQHQDRVLFKTHMPVYNFVLVGGYRTGPRSFAAIGLASLARHDTRRIEGCTWTSSAGDQTNGTIQRGISGKEGQSLFGVGPVI
eukprot:jgi/Mesen1/162/ME1132155C07618